MQASALKTAHFNQSPTTTAQNHFTILLFSINTKSPVATTNVPDQLVLMQALFLSLKV